jgi:transcriptional regulator with XRE-family HTH domain
MSLLWTRTVGSDVVIPMAQAISEATRILGERVRTQREVLGLSQEALAHQSGVHWTFLGQVERGRRNLSLHNLLKVAAGLGIDPAQLVQGLRPPED